MQIDFIIFYLHGRSALIKVPLLSNDFSERTGLALRPAQGELLRSLNFWLRETQPDPSKVFWFIKYQPNQLFAWLASTPTKSFAVLECRFDRLLAIIVGYFYPTDFVAV